jgi:hypothetical protein
LDKCSKYGLIAPALTFLRRAQNIIASGKSRIQGWTRQSF